MDEYWAKVKENAERARKEYQKKECCRQRGFYHSFKKVDHLMKANIMRKWREKYEARFQGGLVLCLACRKLLPQDAYAVTSRGRVHDRCLKCVERSAAWAKERQNPKRKCRKKGCPNMVFKRNELKYCAKCFAAMSVAGRERALLGIL